MQNKSDNDSLTYAVPKDLDEARANLNSAKVSFENSPTYHNATLIQIYQKQFDTMIKEARKTFFTFDGDKGFHTATPTEIVVSALKEILYRGNELTEMYKGLETAPSSYIKYFTSVAKEALKDSGYDSSLNELTVL
jgi:hypothetical protein